MLRRALILAVLLFSGVAPAGAEPASEALLKDLVDWIGSSPEWTASVQLVRSEGADTIGEGLVLSRQEPQLSVSIDRLRLRDLTGREGGGFSATEIEITGGGLISEESEVAVPAASVRKVSIPGTQGLVFDPKHIMTFVAQLYSVMAEAEFSDFSVPEVTVIPLKSEMGGPPPAARLVYRNLTISRLQNGILDRSQAGPITFEAREPEGETRFEVQSVATERVDLGSIAHIFDAANYRDGRGDGIWRPLISGIGYSGLSATGPDGAIVRFDDVAVENVDGRQTKRPMTAVWDRVLDPAFPDEARSEIALEALQAMASAWRVGTIRMDGFSVEAAEKGITAGLSAFTVTGLSNEGIDSLILKGLRGKSPEGFLDLDSFEFAGLVFPEADALMRFAALENDAGSAEHEKALRGAFAALPRLSHVGLHRLAAGTSESDAVSVALLTLDFRNWTELAPEQTELRIEGLDIPARLMKLEPSQAEVMHTLGFQNLVLGISFADRWSPEAGTDDATWKLSLRDGADIELTYRLVGVTADWMLQATAAAGKAANSQAALMQMLEELRLERARLAITDRSLLDRGFNLAAKMQGLRVEGKAYREQMRMALPFLLSAAVAPELSKLLSAPLQSFMAGGQTLIAEIEPAVPVPLSEVVEASGEPADLASRLGLTLRSDRPLQ